MDPKALRKTRGVYKSKLTLFKQHLAIILSCEKLSNVQVLELTNRLDNIRALYTEFDNTQTEIESLCELPGEEEKEFKERETFERDYFSTVALAEDVLNRNSKQVPPSANDDTSLVTGLDASAIASGQTLKLPTIHLPTFSGRYQEWLGFHDTYTSLIHSSASIPKINKFHYLRASLKDSAALVIQSITFSAENYDIAWQTLCDRFNNNRLLINNHIQALFNIEPIVRESSKALRNMIDIVNKNLRALKTLNLPTEHWDALIIHMMSSKLDPVSSREWEEERNRIKDIPTLNNFTDFLKGRADLLETMEGTQNKPRRHSDISHIRPKTFVASPATLPRFSCHLCKGNHSIYQCYRFKELPIESRIQRAKELKLCTNCLRKGHEEKRCTLGPCKLCSKKHHTLLHFEDKKKPTQSASSSYSECVVLPTSQLGSEPSTSKQENITLSCTHQSQVLLSTAIIGVTDNDGNLHKVRALIDNGSTSSFITEQLHSKLKLSHKTTHVSIQGLYNQHSQVTKRCNVNILSLSDSNYRKKISCFIVPHITQMLPTHKINTHSFNIPSHVHLADPSFHTPSEVQILLGADLFWEILGSNHISLGKNRPTLNETKFGWLVSGTVHTQPSHSNSNNHSCNIHSHSSDTSGATHSFNSNNSHSFNTNIPQSKPIQEHSYDSNTVHCHFVNTFDSELQKKLNHYFECETFNDSPRLSHDEQLCEKIFTETTTRQTDGRFVVKYPLKQSPTSLGNSSDLALARFLALERKFNRDSVFKHKYIEFMTDYINLDHMSENTEFWENSQFNTDQKDYFLPHHGVLRENSITTNLRTVFDASAVTSSGLSFNDIQLVGPTVQDDLLSILIRFRQHKYAVTADIEKMYRMILIHPSQRCLQQVLWRTNPSEPIKIYKLNTVTYGTASAPYLATRCLKQLGNEYMHSTQTSSHNENLSNLQYINSNIHNLIGSSILHDFFVDDLVTGNDSAQDLIHICEGIIQQLQTAHFHLRKWRSNDIGILHKIHKQEDINKNPLLIIDDDKYCKILGITWDCKSDTLLFSSLLSDKNIAKQTKRSVLSKIAQIFDPLGLINPCLLQGKLILQQLWAKSTTWDDIIPTELQIQWKTFIDTLYLTNCIQIPRRVICDNPVTIELHSFSDASIHAYSACVYVRSISADGSICVRLLIAKSRVAPFKKNTTIPRLELSGALLATILVKKVKSSLRLQIHSETYWCDSTIVLGWIKMSKSKLKQYVFNRVTEITDHTEPSSWYHVPTDKNPADIGSRGQSAQQLTKNTLWFYGPDFINHTTIQMPPQPHSAHETLPETKIHCHFTNETNADNIKRFSNYSKLQRVYAYVHRFIHNCRNKQNKFTGHLRISELKRSENTLCIVVQMELLGKQYHLLKNKNALPYKDQLLNLNPFIDKNNVMRVGGRLSNSNYSYDTKHPIILHSKHHITYLLTQHYHKMSMHAGSQLMLAMLRQRFWIIGGRNLTRKIARTCVTCCRFNSKGIQPIMGDLPNERLHADFPFQNTAVDYAGPILIADRKGRGCKLIKSYICVFVCLAVRAVHIELVTDLSTDGFLACLNRFIARRGRPAKIFSDNGKNFVGAFNDLSKFLNLKSTEISSYAAENHIEFKFSPAYSPHFNGLVEASVKSIKYHLKRVLGLANLTYEEMTTLLVQIEAILNSRPLTPISSDPSDLVALTPSHFLMGRTILLTPQVEEKEARNINTLKSRFQRIECLKTHFWSRFQREYVSELQKRNKWRRQDGDLRLEDMVLIKDDRLPPNRWLLGRITKLYPGADGISRVADVVTTSGTLRRAYNRLVPLPLLEQDVPRPAGC